MIRLPFISELYANSQVWFSKYAKGIYENGNTKMIVNGEIGYIKNSIRVFNPPEINVITLNRE